MKTLRKHWIMMRFRTKALLLLVLVGVAPLLIFGYMIYGRMTKVLSDEVEKTTFINLQKNIEIMDKRLQEIEEESESLIADPDLYILLKRGLPENDFALLQLYKQGRKVLKRHFDRYADVYNAFLMTTVIPFSSKNNMHVPVKSFYTSSMAAGAIEADGGLRWVPTYDFADMYGLEKYRHIQFSYKKMFTASRLIKPVYNDTSRLSTEGYISIKHLDGDIERPILLLQFKDNIFNEAFENLHTYQGSVHYVIDAVGQVISSSNGTIVSKQLNLDWLDKITAERNGSFYINNKKDRQLLSFSEIETTGWIAIIAIPYESMVASIPDFSSMVYLLMLLIVLLSILASVFASNIITKPIKKILIVLDRMSQGKFHSRINDYADDEIGALYAHFNHLSGRMEHLIQSNYLAKINEKEAIINALTSQINPHFITNTLSTINWMALNINAWTISKTTISLSKILDYTIRNTEDLVTLEKEVECLKHYIFIMSQRFEGVFQVSFNIDHELMGGYVPKLFLQPLVENAINHGFAEMTEGGMIIIEGKQTPDNRYFSVQDNGMGMENIQRTKEDSASIGLVNVQKRIELLYGEESCFTIDSKVGSYTKVSLKLPR